MTDLRAMVDRIEDKMAVLLVGDEDYRLVLPVSFLPEDAAEGDVLSLSIAVDTAATRDAKQRISDIIDRLSRGDG
ncbi:MAG: DUF3006 domain-containing protein [Armatimonadota bacterium]